MTSSTLNPARTYDVQPLLPIATRLLRNRAALALRAVRVFAGAALSVVILGEYSGSSSDDRG